MFSYDINSLFTEIPLDETIDYVIDQLYNYYNNNNNNNNNNNSVFKVPISKNSKTLFTIKMKLRVQKVKNFLTLEVIR